MNICRLVTIGLMLTVLPLAGLHAQVYRWVDEQGRVHYGDKKPQQDAAQLEEVEIRNTQPEQDLQILKNREAMSLINQQREGERAQQAIEAAANEQARQQQQARCAELKKQIQYDDSVAVIFSYDDEGKRVNWTAEQREAYQAKLRFSYAQNCQ